MPRRLVCAPIAAPIIVTQTDHDRRFCMVLRKQSRIRRLAMEQRENRLTPTKVTPIEVPAFEPGDDTEPCLVGSAEANSHNRPFHLEESGAAVFNRDGT